MRPRGLRWCQIYYKESLKMEGEFGDRFHQFLELLVLDDWLDVVSGAKHLYPTVQCYFKLVLERLSQ